MLLIIALTSLHACSASSQNASLGDCGNYEGFCGEQADWDSVQNCTVLYEFKMQGLKTRIDRCY